ncbi:MAG: cellulase [Planctomycetes bacterium]|nr:cellulase [Planctomycetota bacterium]
MLRPIPNNRRTAPRGAGLLVGCLVVLSAISCQTQYTRTPSDLGAAWDYYLTTFVHDGRVVRPRHGGDTVSEGQAYAMLRAVWMDDQETFDRCYRWSEKHLSRAGRFGDNLLAWHYKKSSKGSKGEVVDWTPATDADLDYALALFLASEKWSIQPRGLTPYRKKAAELASDIMRKAVLRLPSGELLLRPWVLDDEKDPDYPLTANPSYFSPAHYRIFEKLSGDNQWGQLADDTYDQLGRISQQLGRLKGIGLVPDWCLVTESGNFKASEEKGTVSSWDAFRLWWRVGLDHRLSGEDRAKTLIKAQLIPFLRSELQKEGRIMLEYEYTGQPLKKYTSAAILGTYAWTVSPFDKELTRQLKQQLAERRFSAPGGIFYDQPDNYYVNSWAWFGDATERDLVKSTPGEIDR